MNASTMDDIAARYPEAFRPSLGRRYSVPLVLLACLAYTGYCWWFFSVGTVLEKANWNLAGNYLADWVSYEIRPDIELHDGYMTINYSKFSELGPNPNPDWVVKEQAAAASGSEPVITRSTVSLSGAELVIEPDLVTVTRGSETIHLDLKRGEQVIPREPLPAWLEQRRPGSTVYASFGFAGRAEIQNDDVVVWRRFLGWANFVFDTSSPFWGKSTGDVISTIVSGPRIDPAQSNLSLAVDNILNNAEWQHGDVWLKLGQTIVMAFVGTLLASIVAFPLAFLAARNITRSWLTNQLLKRSFDFLRSVDMLIWALFFTRGFGPGPISGMAAIFFTDTGTFGKLYSEALENIDDKQREGIKSVGAAPVLVQRFGVLPQVLPVFASQSLYFWESNTRSATIIGAVGAGGIGLKLWEAMRTNSDWENVAYMVLLILMVVFIFDALSNALRKRLMGEKVGH